MKFDQAALKIDLLYSKGIIVMLAGQTRDVEGLGKYKGNKCLSERG